MAETAPPPVRRKRPWSLTFLGVLVMAGLASMPVLAGEATDAELPDIVRFIGRFHPLVLHLPIGVFALILFQEIGAIFARRGREQPSSAVFPMFFGAASAVVAAIAGFLLYHGHAADYGGNELAGRHLWGGLAFAVAAVLTFIVKAWTVSLSANPAWFRLLLFSSVGVMGFASHDGASLTHGSDYLTAYAPAPLREMLGLDPAKPAVPVKPTAEQVVYADIVQPILERRCVQCHKEEKAKGRFRMDTFEMLVKGGKEGPGIEPGSAARSNIVVRMELPQDDDDHMPPEGKPQVEDAELLVIKWWLDQGADPAGKLGDFDLPAAVTAALAKLPATGVEPTSADPHMTVKSRPDESLVALVNALSKDFPGVLSFESRESARVSFSALSLRGKLNDATFVKFAPVIPHLVSADFSATLITDKSVAMLGKAEHLRLLRLAETEVSDASIATLLKLRSLESLNFYGTKVTDSGILKLAALPNLKRLYLWQTAVTPDAVKSLQEKLPDCEIVTGAVSSSAGSGP